MAVRTKETLKAVKNSRYADNVSGLVTEQNHRDTWEDAADSFAFAADVAAAGMLSATVTLSAAEILDLNATPKQVIAAPGANKVISVHRAFLIYTFVSAAYATNTTLRLIWNGVNVTPVGWIALLADTVNRQVTSLANTITGTIDVSNKALMVEVQTGNPTAGDCTIKIIVEYTVIDI